jgi:hypothetical protein
MDMEHRIQKLKELPPGTRVLASDNEFCGSFLKTLNGKPTIVKPTLPNQNK